MQAVTSVSKTLSDDPLWYKDAIIYELHVRAFYDSNGDGIGDFKGLTEKLDYLQDLGITAIWLLPFFPSPLRDDGYDIADYNNVHPSYGSLRDFKSFVKEAHKRGLRVITELAINHTSDQHPWFQRARNAKPGSKARQYYVWSDTPDKYPGVRIIFQDFESSNWSWDPVAKAYYWHRFYSHQPDLNFDNPVVRKEITKILDFWLNLGVDGLRLDAVPYLFERENTNCENLPETHEFLKELRSHVDTKYQGKMLLAEANQWPEDAAAYFGDGDECQMAFHFPIMPRLFIAVRMEDRFPIIDSLEQTPSIPDNCQWAIFLRNHDELTLEMVTDEERDYMYRVYAQEKQARINVGIRRRLAPLMENNRKKIELMKSLLFSLPGAPVIYYGDEIGMGDNIYLGDRNGVRTPMQWSADRNAGFSRANSQSLYLPPIIDQEYHFEALNVETQQNNPSSLLWWTKRFIALRKHFKALSRGATEFLYPDNRKVLAFIRKYENEIMLIVANLSRFVQYAELDLSRYQGMIPVEVFGRNDFPTISDKRYFLTLGPHSFMWFSIESQTDPDGVPSKRESTANLSLLRVEDNWRSLFQKEKKARLERLLPEFLYEQRWFRSKSRQIRSVSINEALKPKNTISKAVITILQVEFKEGDPEIYLLPLSFSTAEKADDFSREYPHAILCRLNVKNADQNGVIHDSTIDPDFGMDLFEVISTQKTLKGDHGTVSGNTTKSFRKIPKKDLRNLTPQLLRGEQSNTSFSYGDKHIAKMYRKLDEGTNPEQEMGQFFEKKKATFTAKLTGYLEYKRGRGEPATVAVLNEYVVNQGDAWKYTLDELSRYFEEVLAKRPELGNYSSSSATALEASYGEIPALAKELIGSYLESAGILGERTGEMHLTLASEKRDPNFTPEEFTTLYQRSLYQSLRNLTTEVFQTLKRKIKDIPEDVRPDAAMILERKSDVIDLFKKVTAGKFDSLRIRCHGDYHLGQALYTGNDFLIMDFEGEPARSIGDRRVKRAPLRDVAGMLRSFHYAVNVAMFGQRELGVIHDDDLDYFHLLGSFWNHWVSAAYIKAYLTTLGISPLIPESHEEFQTMLDIFVLEKAVYELGYELNNRPGWIKIPVDGMRYILGEES